MWDSTAIQFWPWISRSYERVIVGIILLIPSLLRSRFGQANHRKWTHSTIWNRNHFQDHILAFLDLRILLCTVKIEDSNVSCGRRHSDNVSPSTIRSVFHRYHTSRVCHLMLGSFESRVPPCSSAFLVWEDVGRAKGCVEDDYMFCSQWIVLGMIWHLRWCFIRDRTVRILERRYWFQVEADQVAALMCMLFRYHSM